jgi:hypothetical protein
MSRPKKLNKKEIGLENLINETILEVFNSKIETQFKEVTYGNYIAYEFKTNSGTSYDLEFHHTQEYSDTKLNGVETLGEILNTNEEMINCFDIAFSTSNIIDKNNPDEYEKETNKQEQFELFGRISYIVSIIVEKYKKIKVFVIGAAKRNKSEIYKAIFENQFKDKFDLYYGESQNHEGMSLFIIRK